MSAIHQPTQTLLERLAMLQKGATFLMLAFLGVGAGLTLVQGSQRVPLTIGLHLVNAGITMIIAVGAVANHRAILEDAAANHHAILTELAKINARLDNLVSAAGDEVADQRDTHH